VRRKHSEDDVPCAHTTLVCAEETVSRARENVRRRIRISITRVRISNTRIRISSARTRISNTRIHLFSSGELPLFFLSSSYFLPVIFLFRARVRTYTFFIDGDAKRFSSSAEPGDETTERR
jgi:hypothetical protein